MYAKTFAVPTTPDFVLQKYQLKQFIGRQGAGIAQSGIVHEWVAAIELVEKLLQGPHP